MSIYFAGIDDAILSGR